MEEKDSRSNDDLKEVVPLLRRARAVLGRSQKDVAREADIDTHRFRKLESGVDRYVLRDEEAARWAAAVGTTIDELNLEAAGFRDLVPRTAGLTLRTTVGLRNGVETPLETSPRGSEPDAEAEAGRWNGIRYLIDPDEFDDSFERQSLRVEIVEWMDMANGRMREDGLSLDEVMLLTLYPEALFESEVA